MDKEKLNAIKELITENERLRNVKQTHDELLSCIEECQVALGRAVALLSPKKIRMRSSNADYNGRAITNNLYDKMNHGLYVTRGLIRAAYPNVPDASIGNILTQLESMPNVKKAKEGRIIRLYLEKPLVDDTDRFYDHRGNVIVSMVNGGDRQ